MNTSARSIRQQVHELAEQLPSDATWEDVIQEARYRRAVEAGIAAADRGAFATDQEVRETFAKWGVKT
jgi:predicted transcriptional regulator